METNKIDKVFKDAFKNRKVQPSNSAWGRLSLKLEVEEKKKNKKRFALIGYAASFLLFIAISYSVFFNKTTLKDIPTNEIVDTTEPIKIQEFDNIQIETKEEIQIANQETEKQILKEAIQVISRKKPSLKTKQLLHITEEPVIEIAEVHKIDIDTTDIYIASKTDKEKNIKPRKFTIDPVQLLNSIENDNTIVTQSSETLSKSEKLAIIKNELKNAKLTISPEELLAEVDKNIDEKTFREKFINSLKNNISTLATAISERNK